MTILDSSATLAAVSDLSAVLILDAFQESVTDGSKASVRHYAGGRRRVVSQPGPTRTFSLSWRWVSRASHATMLGFVGQTVLYRNSREGRVFGLLAAVVGSEDLAANRLENVTVTIEEITYSEVV